jgi:hypothetical protein
MHYKRKGLLSTLSMFALLPEVALVSGLQIPFSNSKHIKRDDSTVDVTLPDIGFVKTYVCPSKVDLFRRQASGPQTITIPKDQIETFLLELRKIELQMVAAIDAMLKGGRFMTDTVVPSPSSSTPLSSELASIPPEPMTTVATSATTTTTITRTTTLVRTRSRAPDVAASSTAASPTSSIAPTIEDVAAASTTISVPSDSTTNLASTATNEEISGELHTASSTVIPMLHNTARYTFNAQSSSNVAVYFGQSPATGSSSLESQCADTNIDIVILAFIVSPLDGGTYPSVNFGAACTGQTDVMRASAPGLLSCPELAGSIASCQNTHGKKVFLSMGGSTGQISFTSDEEGSAFADVLWQLFGPPGQVDTMLRPFGSVQVDGFDVGSCPFSPPTPFKFHSSNCILTKLLVTRQRKQQSNRSLRPCHHPPATLLHSQKTILPLQHTPMSIP